VKEFAQKGRSRIRAITSECIASRSKAGQILGREAKELFLEKPCGKFLEWKAPLRMFIGGKINSFEKLLDRHLTTHRRNKARFCGRGGARTHAHLSAICIGSLPLRERPEAEQNRKGDRLLLLPTFRTRSMLLAASRAVHSVVLADSVGSIRTASMTAGASAVITATGSYRRGGNVPLKKNVDDALRVGPRSSA